MNDIVLISFIIMLCVLLGGIFVIIRVLRNQTRHTSNHIVYAITIPQYSESAGEREKGSEAIAKRLTEIEGFFSVFAGTRADRSIRSKLFGRRDHFSMEIVAYGGSIRFFVAVPPEWSELFMQQLHAVYPNAHLEQVTDYNIFQPHTAIASGYLVFRKSFIFPLKTYRASEGDPLETITTALSRVPEGGGAAVQLILRSAHGSWHSVARRVIKSVYDGTPMRDAVRHFDPTRTAAGMILKFLTGIFSFLGSSFQTASKKTPDSIKQQPQLSPKDLDAIKGIEEKNSKAGFDANLRIVVSMPTLPLAESVLKNLMDSFGQYNIYEYGNAFYPLRYHNRTAMIRDFMYRAYEPKAHVLLNAEEAVSLFHLPEHIQTPTIQWLKAKKVPPPITVPTEGVLIGYNDYRGKRVPIRIKDPDRRRHVYIIGQTGTGKSELLNRLAIQDIVRGKGVAIIDPHGDLVEAVLQHIPAERARDVIVFDPSDTERPLGLNMLEYETPEQKTFVINEMINIFDKLYDLRQTGGPMFEQYMRNAMLLVMEDPESGSTLMEIPRVLADAEFRKMKLSKTTNIVVKDFWEKEAQKAGGDASLANMVPYITSKLTQFISNDTMRPIIAQQTSAFSFRKAMDEQKILLINLSKGKIGDLNSSLLGLVCVGKLLMAALSRVDMPEAERKDFYLYIDEFQNYISQSIAIILSEARKYKLNLTVAHQYISQLVKNNDTQVRDAVFGNVGTMVSFRIGAEDAEALKELFAPTVSVYDLVNVEKYQAYIRLLIDNQPTAAFSFAPEGPKAGNPDIARAVKQTSRLTYGIDRRVIEEKLHSRLVQKPTLEREPLPPIA